MKTRKQVTPRQVLFAALLQDQTLFMRHFWRSDLTLPPSTRQKAFFNDESRRKLLCTGRKTAKTLNIEAAQIRYSINHRASSGAVDECLMVTPGEKQIDPIWDRVVNRIDNNPLFKLLCVSKPKNEGKIVWATGVIWYYRIDGSSGTDANMIGLRCKYIIGDEMALTVRVCHNSRKQSALPDCRWFYGGVPNGVRHTPFWELDQTRTGRDWSRHKFSTYVNPIYWNDKAVRTLKDDFVEGSQDYLTQVIGAWGEEVFSSFPPGNLAIDERLPYTISRIQGADIPLEFTPLDVTIWMSRIGMPRIKDVYQYALGMDYGFLQDPTEITVGYRTENGSNAWKLCARIELQGANPKQQARFLQMLAEGLGRAKIAQVCLDQAHAGIGIATDLLESYSGAWWAKVLSDFAANGTLEVDVAGKGREAIETDEPALNVARKKKVRRKQHFTQVLQMALLAAKNDLPDAPLYLTLAHDTEMVQELIDTREKRMQSGYIVYIPRQNSSGNPIDHVTDSLRALVAAMSLAGMQSEDEDEDEGVVYEEEPLFGRKIDFQRFRDFERMR